MRNKIRSFLQNRISPGDRLIAAVSGGMDSMAMLYTLHDLAPEFPFSLSVAHFNHQLRGMESDRDAAFVQDCCSRLKIPFSMGQGDVAGYAKAHFLGLEEAARILRYDFLQSLDPDAWILTAHTAEDNLETVLMHLIRGSGLQGLGGIAPVRGRLIRPLLDVSREDIEAYCRDNRIRYFSPADYSEGTELDRLVKAIIDRTVANEKLESVYYQNLKESRGDGLL